ncbi:unnamed protein product [Chondrus crispus]|uniref:Uncharacterized protein n=1 Tax=Chondrus crispus TaxID=2769 RepID=R7Q5F7_CHOCR|nr:unnamed protein product [Chondrus crispus]CDF32601.1 unnamed protein product [Chondrus crispus]|eukprot:XP_005712372.1 unnamed protein product [Chondrus crispus]
MDKVPVPPRSPASDAVTPSAETTPLISPAPPLADHPGAPDSAPSDAGIFDRFLTRVHAFFSRFCHSLGAFFLRALSTLMLLAGVVASVVVQMLAYYYTGVLNPWVFLACLLFAPTLAAVTVIRAELNFSGPSRSGAGPRMSQYVTLAYLVITVFAVASLMQPVVMHGENKIPGKSMWTALGGVALFYYSMLVSEVLYAVALNIDRAKERDDELLRRDRDDPFWLSSYNATRQA